MTPHSPEHGALDSLPDFFSILTLIAFGPILPATLITCHHARAQLRAKHAHLVFV